MSEIVVFSLVLAVLLIGGMFFAYRAGQVNEKSKMETEKSIAVWSARNIRASLRNPDVVKRLQRTYDRRKLL